MGKLHRNWIGLALALLVAICSVGWSAVSDAWSVQANSGGRKAIAWRVTSGGDLLPGVATTFDLGSTTYPVKALAYRRENQGHTAYSANTTLTVASPGLVACTNATAVITLANATTAGAGARQIVVNEASAGNIVVASASNISGGANTTIVQATAGEFVSSGTNWFRLY